ncbi:3-methyladenine DNA glycosylase [Lapillicoccus sp.]|uniref:3-methyladenine DNA glycosylase n=1 Tax=Lapillicoccus sp. TaxID=1909287 RepID=UPI0025FD10BC|nr:3-methyladenine DNA glycosylase [Lapillicoccus sp.]
MPEVLPLPVWRERERAHAARIDAATAGHRTRRDDGRKHPVEDFLFSYYSHRPAALRRWHPGSGVVLEEAAATERAGWRFSLVEDNRVTLDLDAFLAARGRTVSFIRDLLTRTLDRKPHLGCFGLHEWAMVYRQDEDQLRHAEWPLRLGTADTDAVVESQRVACSHFDAFRFFTEPARPLNTVVPTRDSQVALEQPGCLHAGMDVYKWAYKLTPAVPSELVADCFDLARDIRLFDMRAAPYDLAELGVVPVPIETASGRAAYVEAQRGFAERSQALRARLVAVCDRLLADVDVEDRQDAPGDRAAGDLADAAGTHP